MTDRALALFVERRVDDRWMTVHPGRLEGAAPGWARREGQADNGSYAWSKTIARSACQRLVEFFEPRGPRGLPSDVSTVVRSAHHTYVVPDGLLTASETTRVLGHDNHAFASEVAAGLANGILANTPLGLVDTTRVSAPGWALADELFEHPAVLADAGFVDLIEHLRTVRGFVRVVYWRTHRMIHSPPVPTGKPT